MPAALPRPEKAAPQHAVGKQAQSWPRATVHTSTPSPHFAAPPEIRSTRAAPRGGAAAGLAARVSCMDDEPRLQAAPAGLAVRVSCMDDEPPLQAAPEPAPALAAAPAAAPAAALAAAPPAEEAGPRMHAAPTAPWRTHADAPRTSTQQRPVLASKRGLTVGLFSRTIISKAEAAQAAIASQRTAAPNRSTPSAAGDQAHREHHAVGRAASLGFPEPHADPFRQHSPAMPWEGVSRSAAPDSRCLPRPSAPLSSAFAPSPLPTPRHDSVPPRHMPGLNLEADRLSARTRFCLQPPSAIDASHMSVSLVDELVCGEANTLEEVSALLASDLRRGQLWARSPAAMDTGDVGHDRAWCRPPAAAERSEYQYSHSHSHSAPLRYTDADGLRHYLQPFGLGCRTDTDDEDEDEDCGYDVRRGEVRRGISVRSTAGQYELDLPLRYPTVY